MRFGHPLKIVCLVSRLADVCNSFMGTCLFILGYRTEFLLSLSLKRFYIARCTMRSRTMVLSSIIKSTCIIYGCNAGSIGRYSFIFRFRIVAVIDV